MSPIPNKSAIQDAHFRINPYIHRSPILSSSFFNERFGAELFFKCENLQKVGAFKIRGATNAILQLSPENLSRGVCTHSSGNHAQAVALAARNLGIPAYIVMPSTSPAVKKAAVEGYGAEITMCEPTLAARESTAQAVLDRTGATFIHPYNDYEVITGQATAAKELIEDVENLDLLIAPVGGGGLLAGSALSAHYFSPGTKVYGAEPQGADDAFRSFRDKTLHPSVDPKTIADGLLTSLGERNLPIILEHVQGILLASEEGIVQAMREIWERMKIVVEASSAVPIAAMLESGMDFSGKRIGIVLSGGNVDLGKLPF